MNTNGNDHIVDNVISLIEVFVVMTVEEVPITGIVLAVLLKTITHDRLIRIMLILLVIALGETESIRS